MNSTLISGDLVLLYNSHIYTPPTHIPFHKVEDFLEALPLHDNPTVVSCHFIFLRCPPDREILCGFGLLTILHQDIKLSLLTVINISVYVAAGVV